jgi:fumarate hydratase class II
VSTTRKDHDDVTDTTTPADGEFRIEHDTMGEVRVPASALYRAQTQRA